MRNLIKTLFFVLTICSSYSCLEDINQPKPKGFVRLEYPKNSYKKFNSNCGFGFEYSDYSNLINKPNDCSWVNLSYPKMKATIYLTHKKINNDFDKILYDAQKITKKHAVKADFVSQEKFINGNKNGSIFNLGGKVASPLQFYITDKTSNFLLGSVYFYTKPNPDSLKPAINYIKKDIKKIMETMSFKN